jgi:uncharacterized protein YwqG
MDINEVLRQLEPWREKWQRPAWRPLTVSNDSAETASKFAGTPWLAKNETWPTCQQCHKPMPLFLQLNLERLPASLTDTFGTGLLQLFYCLECDGGWEPFSDVSLVRIVHPHGPAADDLPQGVVATFPPQTIIGWEEFIDYPDPQEHEELGLEYTYDFDSTPTQTRIDYPEAGLVFDHIEDDDLAEKVSRAAAGDKLCGWPQWIQGIEYPTCPQCQQRMALVFQIDSEDHLPYMFGDMGTGHITQCPTHKEVVAFAWACG